MTGSVGSVVTLWIIRGELVSFRRLLLLSCVNKMAENWLLRVPAWTSSRRFPRKRDSRGRPMDCVVGSQSPFSGV